jgi:hypothetical protein
MISMLLVYATFLFIGILTIFHIVKALRERMANKWRLLSILIAIAVLAVTYVKPYGIIDFQQFEPSTILEASRTGGGNCNENL